MAGRMATSPSRAAAVAAIAAGAAAAGAALLVAWRLIAVRRAAGSRLHRAGRPRLRLARALAAPRSKGRDLVVTGVVASLPQQGAERPALSLRARSGAPRDGAPVAVPRALALGWYARLHEDAALAAPQRRAARRPALALHGAAAPAARQPQSARLRLRADAVRAGRARHRLRARRAGDAARRERRPPGRARCASACATRSRRSVADRRAAGVLAALAVGDQGAIERDDWDLFRNTGVAHLMSISGLHVTMFAWLAGLGDRRGVAAQPRRDAAAAGAASRRAGAGSLAATAYAVFSGWGVPSQRTVWMLATVDAAAARPACAGRGCWCCCRRRGRRHGARPLGADCSPASGCRSWRSGC